MRALQRTDYASQVDACKVLGHHFVKSLSLLYVRCKFCHHATPVSELGTKIKVHVK